MNFHSIRVELRSLGVRNLFEIVMNQKESKCILNGLCPFYFKHRGYGFCLSEVLGKGCELQKLEKLQRETYQTDKGLNFTLPLFIFKNDEKTAS
jgi:hypothetical protein